MDIKEFKEHGYRIVDLIAEYFGNIREYPVLSDLKPGEILSKLPSLPPEDAEQFDDIIADFNRIIMPGITHWQSPNFHAYFPANSSFPSVLAEFLTSAIGAQCMSWLTSPAATELEEMMMVWLRSALGLSDEFTGVIQDTASTATLVALLTARERHSCFLTNSHGVSDYRYRIYCSAEAHSSVEKAVKIAGMGSDNLIRVPVNGNNEMISSKLNESIQQDIDSGYVPLFVVSAVGTTGTLAIDPVSEIADIASKYHIWHHIDAAYLGSAMILPEWRHYFEGINFADSFVFNPHKWMMTNFDCSAFFVRDVAALVRTFEMIPEYLKTSQDSRVNNYKDWGIQLGRRFRALKLWFVIRSYGLSGIRGVMREHIRISNKIRDLVVLSNNFELMAPADFNVICFRWKPSDLNDDELNRLNEDLLNRINSTGRAFLTHTKISGRFVIRLVIAQTYVTEQDAIRSWELINRIAGEISY